MQLREGIRIVGSDINFLINDGAELATEAKVEGYREHGFVPRQTWREPNAEEREILIADGRHISRGHHGLVKIVSLPQDLQARITRSEIGDLKSLEDFIPFVQRTEYRELQRDLIDFARTYLVSEEGFLVHSPVINPPGLLTVTIQGPTGALLGMHLDSWERMPLTSREAATNRICINLGREARYLLFMNLPMAEVVAALPEQERGQERAVQAFLERHSDYPIVRVRVNPGEAYIAPTENMIHDGASQDRTSSDIHLTARGHFGMEAQSR